MGYKVLCFLNTYKGYHQIPMALEDMEKIAFVTKDDIFCYTRMSFWLKNAQAEFQDMVNKVFGDQISRNMEVYVYDIILKSRKVEMLPTNMRETFEKILHVVMQLNPKKCKYGVPSRKCLGFIVSKKGTEADSEKIKATQQMLPPKNVNDVHRLLAYMVYLGIF